VLFKNADFVITDQGQSHQGCVVRHSLRISENYCFILPMPGIIITLVKVVASGSRCPPTTLYNKTRRHSFESLKLLVCVGAGAYDQ